MNNTQQTSRYRYNGLNKLAEATDALGNTTTYEYNNLGYQIARTVTDKQTGESHITRSEYNNLGWNTQTRDAEGRIFTSSYDAVGNVIDVVENGLRTTTNSYDKLNRKTQVTVTSGSETTIDNTTYDTVGNVIRSIDAKGNPTTYKYDDLNRRTKVIDAKGQDTDYVYDEVGNLTKIIPTLDRKIVYTYDNLNRRTLVTDAEGIKTRSVYNEFGEVVEVIENADTSGYRTTRYEYDKLGRKVKTIDALNKETITTYDEADNVTSVTDANNNKISYVYDDLNRGKESTQSYDGLGRVSQIKDRNNRTRTFGYDINDNLTTESWGNGIGLSFTYDLVGNLLSSTDGTSNTTNIYGYDDIYQLTSAKTSNSDVKFEYAYDEFGDKIQRLDVRDGTNIAGLSYTYNNNHQLKFLTQSGTGLATQRIEFAYDKLSQLDRVKRWIGNSSDRLITDYGYDTVGRLTGITNQFNGTTISNYIYGYDDGSRLKTKGGSDGNGTVSYGRDNQISGVDYSSRPDESYDFNALGIRSGWVTDALDSRRVLSDGKYEFTYDNEGNLIERREISSGKLTNYQWDYRNRLTRVNLSDGSVVAYGYDAEDRRVSKQITTYDLRLTTYERYVYDGDDIALVVDAAGTIVERYLYGAGVDNVLSVERGNNVTWSLADRQGSVVDLVDEGGNVLNHFVYDSFGNRTESTSVGFRFGYTGRELDNETGLYYYRARYYDPSLGRFISEDPIGFSAGDTNLYRYVSNSPTNFTDPTGLLISGWAEDALYAADAFFAGFGNVVSFGITNKIRSTNQLAVENQQGGWYNLGTFAGIGASLALNPLGSGHALARGTAAGYQGFGTVSGIWESGGNILSGNGTGWDAINLLPVAIPLIGFAWQNRKAIGNGLRKIGDELSNWGTGSFAMQTAGGGGDIIRPNMAIEGGGSGSGRNKQLNLFEEEYPYLYGENSAWTPAGNKYNEYVDGETLPSMWDEILSDGSKRADGSPPTRGVVDINGKKMRIGSYGAINTNPKFTNKGLELKQGLENDRIQFLEQLRNAGVDDEILDAVDKSLKHAEGMVAMYMRKNKIKQASLYINNYPICGNCQKGVEYILGNEYTLTVRHPNSKFFTGNSYDYPKKFTGNEY